MKSLTLFSILILNVLHCDCFHQYNSVRSAAFSNKICPIEGNQLVNNAYSSQNGEEYQSKAFLGRKKLSSISLRMSPSDDGVSKVIIMVSYSHVVMLHCFVEFSLYSILFHLKFPIHECVVTFKLCMSDHEELDTRCSCQDSQEGKIAEIHVVMLPFDAN